MVVDHSADLVFVGEVKTPWIREPFECSGICCGCLRPDEAAFRHILGMIYTLYSRFIGVLIGVLLGQVARYMRVQNVIRAFFSTYEETIFLRKFDVGTYGMGCEAV